MPKRVRTALAAALLLLLIVSLGMVIWEQYQYWMNAADYEDAKELVDLPSLPAVTAPPPTPALTPSPTEVPTPTPAQETAGVTHPPVPTPEPAPSPTPVPTPVPTPDPYAKALANMDFTALREVNSDVVGWIVIPDTNLSYPLLHGEDNDFYLKHNWKKKRTSGGSIYIECKNDRDMSGFNTIIYGHRMRDSSMFATLRYYAEQDFWREHPYVYITDDAGSRRYEIFAAWEPAVDEPPYYLSYPTDADKQALIDLCLERSVIDTGVVPNVWDRIITLSTCTGDGHETRWVVQAVYREEPPAEPSPAAEQE